MTDTPPQTPPAAPPQMIQRPFEPDPGTIEFVNQGIIRFHFPTQSGEDLVIRVRRPFLGELKAIRLDLAELQDELAVTATSVTLAGRDLQVEATELSDKLGRGEITNEQHGAELADIRRRDRIEAQRMEDERESKILGWWTRVFEVLALDEVPDDVLAYPAWILDARLPNHVLTHWRHVPSGPG